MRHHILIVLAAALSVAACNQYVVSPPTQFLPLESPRAVPAGQHGIDLEGGVAGAIFGPEVAGGALRYRYGIAETVELNVEGAVGWVANIAPENTTDRTIVSGRVGAKGLVLSELLHLSWTAGLGGGASAAGGFITPDVGLVIGYEGRIFVPFLHVSVLASLPVDAREVDITRHASDVVLDTPHTTFGVRHVLGLRIRAKPIGFAFGLTVLYLEELEGDGHTLLGFSVALSSRF